MKTIIAGSRDITDYQLVCKVIEESGFQITEVVCGGARGVDDLGRKWAANGYNIPVKVFPADWDGYKKGAAGPIRNAQMAEYADALIAIWDGSSPGTKNMIGQAKKRGLRVFIHIVGQDEGLMNFIKEK